MYCFGNLEKKVSMRYKAVFGLRLCLKSTRESVMGGQVSTTTTTTISFTTTSTTEATTIPTTGLWSLIRKMFSTFPCSIISLAVQTVILAFLCFVLYYIIQPSAPSITNRFFPTSNPASIMSSNHFPTITGETLFKQIYRDTIVQLVLLFLIINVAIVAYWWWHSNKPRPRHRSRKNRIKIKSPQSEMSTK